MPHEIDLNIVKNIISLLEVCTDSFAFVYDISSDLFFISERTLAHYDLPGARFSGAIGKIIMFIHEDERVRCAVDIESIISNKKRASARRTISATDTANMFPPKSECGAWPRRGEK